MMRFCTLALVAALLAACQAGGGAVSVRWRIVDLTTGDQWDPTDVRAADGSCCYYRDASNRCCTTGDANRCSAVDSWDVQNVRIELADPTTGASVPLTPPLTPIACSQREQTTSFTLPPGTYAVSLSATNVDGSGVKAPVALPAPSVREIIAGGVVNLDVIEIGVNPLPLPGPGSGVTF
jgi:hypothetical protein